MLFTTSILYFYILLEKELVFHCQTLNDNFDCDCDVSVNKGNNKITEQSYKGKVKTHNYINRQNQSTTRKL
jgi:hypothetical protein